MSTVSCVRGEGVNCEVFVCVCVCACQFVSLFLPVHLLSSG